MRRLMITAGDVSASAELLDSPTADAVWEALPLEVPGNTWGDEIYFAIPAEVEADPGARADVAVGDLGYWPPGNAFCIFYGRTPASNGDAPRAASPVNLIGRVLGDATVFRRVRSGAPVRIERG